MFHVKQYLFLSYSDNYAQLKHYNNYSLLKK